MTPTATTPAARRRVRPSPAPRRVSGPVTGRGAAVGAKTGRTGPSTRTSTRPTLRQRPSLGARAVAYVRAMPDHALLDRLIRGRAWIPVLGVMLAGIVAMQVEVLKLGATMGRAIERGSALQSRNEILRDNVATLQDEQRIARIAAGYGMVMPSPGDVGFLTARTANIDRAAANIKAPDPAVFSAVLSSNGAIAQTPTAPTPSTATPTSSTTGTATAGSSTTPAAGPAAPSTTTPTAPAVSTGSSGTATPGTAAPSGGTTSSPTSSAGTTAATAAATGGGALVTGG